MLNKLLQFGLENGYFEILEIRNIEKSCCKHSVTSVIDFDATKRKIVDAFCNGTFHIQEPKSCDALKILPEINRLDFIEFKGVSRVIADLSSRSKVNQGVIQKRIEKFDFRAKITDSLWVLQTLLQSTAFQMTKSERTEFLNTEKNYFILVDVEIEDNPIQNLALTMEFLSVTSSITSITNWVLESIQNEIGEFDNSMVNVNKPKLISGKFVDAYYQSLLPEGSIDMLL